MVEVLKEVNRKFNTIQITKNRNDVVTLVVTDRDGSTSFTLDLKFYKFVLERSLDKLEFMKTVSGYTLIFRKIRLHKAIYKYYWGSSYSDDMLVKFCDSKNDYRINNLYCPQIDRDTKKRIYFSDDKISTFEILGEQKSKSKIGWNVTFYKINNEDVLINFHRYTSRQTIQSLIDHKTYEKISGYKLWPHYSESINSYYINYMNDSETRYSRLHRWIMCDGMGDKKLADSLVVDHINLDQLDNRVNNLRLVSFGDNIRNQGIRKDNTTGRKGVYVGVSIEGVVDRYVADTRLDTPKTKAFSVKKYGKEVAFKLASNVRDAYEQKYTIRTSTVDKR